MDNPTDIKLETLLLGVSQEYFIDWISRFVKKVNLDALYTLNPKTNFALMYQTELMGPNPISGEIETIRVMYATYNPNIPFEYRYPIGKESLQIKRNHIRGIYQGEEEIFFYPFLDFRICILDDSRIEVTPYVINRWIHDINERKIFKLVGEIMIKEIKKRWPNQIKTENILSESDEQPQKTTRIGQYEESVSESPVQTIQKTASDKRGPSKAILSKLQGLRKLRKDMLRNNKILPYKTNAVDMIPIDEDTVKKHDRELWDNWDNYEYDSD